MNTKVSLTAFTALQRLLRMRLSIPVKKEPECVPADNMHKILLTESRKRKKAKSLPKPLSHHYSRDISRLGARPKIVTSKEFPNRANAVHYAPPKSERTDHLMRKKYV